MAKVKDLEPILNRLFATYPNFKPDRNTLATYLRFVADIPPDQLNIVIEQCMIDQPTFCPSPGHVRACWLELTSPPTLSADEAWARVQRAMRQVGYMGVPDFADANVTAVVQALGWTELCHSENQSADRAHFLRLYEARLERQRRERAYLPASRLLQELSSEHAVTALPAPPRALPEPVEPVQFKSGAGFQPVGDFLQRMRDKFKAASKGEDEDARPTT